MGYWAYSYIISHFYLLFVKKNDGVVTHSVVLHSWCHMMQATKNLVDYIVTIVSFLKHSTAANSKVSSVCIKWFGVSMKTECIVVAAIHNGNRAYYSSTCVAQFHVPMRKTFDVFKANKCLFNDRDRQRADFKGFLWYRSDSII